MSVVGPEFYQFIKKLEENGDKLPPGTPIEEPLEFEFNNSSCYLCNGYYGPSFGEPVCVTCHAFLFPDFPSYLPSSYFCSEKTDDGDSGNDEPSDLNYSSERRVNKSFPLPAWWYYRGLTEQLLSTVVASERPDLEEARGQLIASRAQLEAQLAAHLADMQAQVLSGLSDSVGWPVDDLSLITTLEAIKLKSDEILNSLDSETSPEDDGSRASNSGPGASGSGSGGSCSATSLALQEGSEDLAGHGPPPQPPSLALSLQALSTPRMPDNLPPGLVEHLPAEVLLCIFRYLDDLSLCACARVCGRWRGLVRARVPPPRWAAFAARRWPLYRPLLANIDWHKKYQSLVESCFCRNCLVQMCVQAQPAGEDNAWRRNRLRIELKVLRNDPPEGIAATPLDPKCCHWQASVTGPVGSPYEGGLFFLYIQVPYSYPMSPPVVRFLTRVLHPNVSRHGDVGIDSVHHNWSLALTLSKVLISIQSLLTDPYTEVCMEPAVGEMYVRDRARFETLARRWTWRYAMHDILPE